MDVNVTLQDVTATLKIEAAPPEPPPDAKPPCRETDGEFLRYHGYVFARLDTDHWLDLSGRRMLTTPRFDPDSPRCDGWTIGPFTFGTDELGPPDVPKRR